MEISMLPTNFGQVVGTIVSEINQKKPTPDFTVTELKIKVQGANEDMPALPLQAFNGIGDSIAQKYNQGDLVSLFYEPRLETWNTPDGEIRSALRLQITQVPITIRYGKKGLEQRANQQAQPTSVKQ
tara:strand:- start:1031 stop:1411 length:381 start_codon:yes stop_codon:yes gene_type:complete